jgi:hypothetical protein
MKQTARVVGFISGLTLLMIGIGISTFMEALAATCARRPTTESFLVEAMTGVMILLQMRGLESGDEDEPAGERGAGDGTKIELTQALHATIDAMEATATGVTNSLGYSSITVSKIVTFVEHGYFSKG